MLALLVLTSAFDTACQAGLDCDSAGHCNDALGGSATLPAGGSAVVGVGGSGGAGNLGGGVSVQAGSSNSAGSGALGGNSTAGSGGSSSGGSNAGGGNAAGAGNGGVSSLGGMSGAGGTTGNGGVGGTTGGGAGSSGNAGGGGKAGNGGSPGNGGASDSAGSSNHGGSSNNGGSSGAGSGGMSGSGGGGSVDPYASARQTCVDRVNQLRATKGLGPIPRLSSAETCADGQAQTDSQTGMAHSAFSACLDQVKGWTGAAQNECPGWGSVADTLSGCIDAMWAEGPGGGHYENMIGDYDYLACGFYTTAQGKVWMVQDFWRK